jgi:hypothetical protein
MDGLFPPDVDLGQHRVINGGCANPIGRQGRPRRRGYQAPARPTTLTVLSDTRRRLNNDLPALRHAAQQIRQEQHAQAARLSETNDLLQHMLGRIHKLERAAGIVDSPRRRGRPATGFSISAWCRSAPASRRCSIFPKARDALGWCV